MSVMFRPPSVISSEIGWVQTLGFRQGREAFFARVRAAQMAALNRYVPFNVGLFMLNVLILANVLGGHREAGFMAAWATLLGGLSAVWMVRFAQSRRRGEAGEATARHFWLVTAEVLCFGLLWAVMAVVMTPAASADAQALILLLSLVAMGACGFATAMMPVCGIVTATLIGAGIMVALPVTSAIFSAPVVVAMATYWLVIVRGILVTSRAFIQRMRVEADLSERNEVVQLLLNEFEANGSDWLLEIDAEGRFTHVSDRFVKVARRAEFQLLGHSFRSLASGADAAGHGLNHIFEARLPFRDLVVPMLIEGEERWWALSGTPKFDAAGVFSGFRSVGRDVTEVRRTQERIASLARFDPLTGLANRTLFHEALDTELARADRGGAQAALLFIDLDRFKPVNDAYGHAMGDRLLIAVAERLRHAAGPEATVARLGGDEFAVVIGEADVATAEAIGRAIIEAVGAPFPIDDQMLGIGASIGWALGPADGATAERLLKCADLALYEVKSSGRGAACRFAPAIRERAEERRFLERALADALAKEQFSLAFQPVVHAADERITGFEALLRWDHPELGRVPPDRFIPVAEETGAIVAIGHWVIREACRWAGGWPEELSIAVNLSPAQIDDPALVGVIKAALAENRLSAGRLELEITERLFVDERPSTIERLAALNAIGIRFALDDFGTGYSALGYLQKAAFSRIKIDRSFVQRAAPGSEASAIIEAIVRMATSLQMTTTAEGTETRAEFETVRDLGCVDVQGYLFGRPMPAEAADALARGLAKAEPERLAAE